MRKKFTIVIWLSLLLAWTQKTNAQTTNVIIGDTTLPDPSGLLQLESRCISL